MITIDEVRAELRRAVEYGESLRAISPEHDRALACARRALEIVDEYEQLVRRLMDIDLPATGPGTVYDFVDDASAIEAVADLQRDYRWKP